ncbi:helix-turn-helix transcriptional regulator [Natronospira bacteriovora]|uniref:helix-turn-helix transcriptional regulator n=1 Tax=Natronospira bacteriovora TaxID=3069753 RepID=UPI0035B5565F
MKSEQIEPAFLRPKQAAKFLGCTLRTVHNLAESDPQFPRKIRVTSRMVGWLRSDLEQYLDRKAAA